MRTVYILRSLSVADQWYVGMTRDLAQRVAEHNASKSPHTSKFVPWEVVVSLNFQDDSKAAEFERYLKSGSGRAFALRHFR